VRFLASDEREMQVPRMRGPPASYARFTQGREGEHEESRASIRKKGDELVFIAVRQAARSGTKVLDNLQTALARAQGFDSEGARMRRKRLE
jgi:hypothetical protein